MPKINVDCAYLNHPKVRRLKLYCGPEADIFPIRLWAFCAEYFSKDGTLKDYTAPEIEAILGWHGNAGNLVTGLLKAGFIEKQSDLVWQIHDWLIHAEHIYRYAAHGAKMAKKRWKSKLNKRCYKHATGIPTGNAIELNGIELNRDKDKDKALAPVPTKREPGARTPVVVSQSEKNPDPLGLVTLWNELAHPNLPRVRLLPDKRKRSVVNRMKEFPDQNFWISLVQRINKSKLLLGENGRGWRCDFDWVMNPNNLTKIIEGNYDR